MGIDTGYKALYEAERERADALAAHVAQLNTAIDRALDYTPLHKNAHQRLRYVQLLQHPETSLAQRDARVAAEALRDVADRWEMIDKQTLVKMADEIAAGGSHD